MAQSPEDARRSSPTPVNPSAVDLYHADVYDGDETHLLHYVKVLHKRRWTVATVFLVVVLTATVYAFTETPIYEARVRLLIEVDDPNVVQFQQVLEETQSVTNYYYETQYRLLQSRSLIRTTLDDLDLWDDPVFLGVTEHSGFSLSGAISTAIGTLTSLATDGVRLVVPAAVPATAREWEPAEDTQAESEAITAFLGNFAVRPVGNSRLVDVTYRSTHRQQAAAIINAHADSYINRNLEFRFLTSRDAANWLGEQLAGQRQAVEESEAALHRYRREHDAVSLEDRENIVVQRLTELNAVLTRAKTDRIAREEAYRQLETTQGDRDLLGAHPLIVSNSFIQQVKAELAALQRERAELAQTLGERHPRMIKVQGSVQAADARLQVEIDKVVQSVRNEFLWGCPSSC